jgi:hypothetical protein
LKAKDGAAKAMPDRFKPLQLAAAVIIGIMAGIIILIFYQGVWL